jgi:hypothetical protein
MRTCAPSQKIAGVKRIHTSHPGAMAAATRESSIGWPANRRAMYVSAVSAIAGSIQTAVTIRHGMRELTELCIHER